jgi:hypothetical protein
LKQTPLAFFAFNRPAHVKDALESLGKCIRLDEVDIYIYCDGPRDSKDEESIRKTRKIIHDWAGKHQAKVIERETNLGLAGSIVGEVTRLCAEYGRVIVVEDDLVVSPYFIDYMLNALDKYEKEERVFQISGYMFPINIESDKSAFLINFASTWGWATWQRAWQYYERDLKVIPEELKLRKIRKAFNIGNSYPYYDLLQGRLKGDNSSWGIIWWWTIFKNSALCLFPKESLVKNCGADGSGRHCNTDDQYLWEDLNINEKNIVTDIPAFPDIIDVDIELSKQIRTFLLSFKKKWWRLFH